jgi:hypothetical protein
MSGETFASHLRSKLENSLSSTQNSVESVHFIFLFALAAPFIFLFDPAIADWVVFNADRLNAHQELANIWLQELQKGSLFLLLGLQDK